MIYYVYHIKRPDMPTTEGYIGITNNPTRRFKEHQSNTHYNPYLQRALQKYNDITLEVIHCCFTKEAAIDLELLYRPNPQQGWNIAKGGIIPPDQTGYSHTDETKTLISKHSKGANNSMYGQSGLKAPSAKPANIYCYKTDKLIAENVCIQQWLRENNCRANHLQATARNTRKSPKGFYAKYT